MKKNNLVLLILSFAISFFLCTNIAKADYSDGIFIKKANGGASYNAGARPDLVGNSNYIYYKYQTEDENDAYCIDAHVRYGGDGFYKPAVEGAHKHNFYDSYLTSEDPSITGMHRGYILIGQYANDAEMGTTNSGGVHPYEYVDIQIALRLWNYASEYKIEVDAHTAYSGDMYYSFVGAPNPSEPEVMANGLTDAQTLFNYAARLEDNPYIVDARDGFSYPEGFWESRSTAINEWGEWKYPGVEEVDINGTKKYKVNHMFKTNVRANDGYNTGSGITCDNFLYVHGDIEESGANMFNCNIVEAPDELFNGRAVNYVHIESKEGVYLDSKDFAFKVNYSDGREADNFWLFYKPTKYSDNWNLTQRMFVSQTLQRQIKLIVGNPTPTCVGCACDNSCETSKKTKSCIPLAEKASCSGSITIKDDADCIFGQNGKESTINTSVSDKNGNDKHTYTSVANEYCNISCAEEINFTMPKEVSNITAGTYFTFEKYNPISATGTRTCRATLAMNTFKTRVSNDLNSSATKNNVIDGIISKKGSNFEYNDNKKYSFKQQNSALNSLYNDLKNRDIRDYSRASDCNCDDNGCDKRYSLTVEYAGYEFSHTNSCGGGHTFRSSNLTNGSTTLKDFEDTIKSAIGTTAGDIEAEIDKLNLCTTAFDEDKASNYDFNPNIKYTYYEPYTKFFSDKYKKTDVERSSTSTSANFNTTTTYYSRVNGSSVQSASRTYALINSNSNSAYIEAKEVKTIKQYSSPIEFFAAVPSGVATVRSKGNYIDYSNNAYTNVTKLDNDVYPVALTTKGGTHPYSFTLSELGDYSLATSDSVGRLDKLLTNEQKTYYCKYSTIQDICVDSNGVNCKNHFFYRNISLTNFDPNHRSENGNIGKNWNVNDKVFGKKAAETLAAIDKKGEDAYQTPEYSFTLTPDNMINIKKYNQIQETGNVKNSSLPRDMSASGLGYANFDMTAVNINGEKVETDSSQALWFKSKFLANAKSQKWVTKSEDNSTFKKWTGSTTKLTGPGPAWK